MTFMAVWEFFPSVTPCVRGVRGKEGQPCFCGSLRCQGGGVWRRLPWAGHRVHLILLSRGVETGRSEYQRVAAYSSRLSLCTVKGHKPQRLLSSPSCIQAKHPSEKMAEVCMHSKGPFPCYQSISAWTSHIKHLKMFQKLRHWELLI